MSTATRVKKQTFDVVVNIVLEMIKKVEGKDVVEAKRLAHFPLKRRGTDTDDALAWYLQNVVFKDNLNMTNNVTLVARSVVSEGVSISIFVSAVDFGYCPQCGSIAGTPNDWCPMCSNVQAPTENFDPMKRLAQIRGVKVEADTEEDEEEEEEEAPQKTSGTRNRVIDVEAK